MFKKFLSLLFSFCIALSFSSMTASANHSIDISQSATLTTFQDFYKDESSLLSDNILSSQISVTVEWDALSLHVSGQVPSSNAFDINIDLCDGAFVSAEDRNENYRILSVIPTSEFVRIIMADLQLENMYYVNLTCNELSSLKPFNVNWYLEFLSPSVTVDDEPPSESSPQASTRIGRKTYTQTTTIYGDVFKEILVLLFPEEWPPEINTSTGGEFKVTMGIGSKTTQYTPYGSSSSTTYDGNSMLVNNVNLKAVTRASEYFSYALVRYKGNVAKATFPLLFGVSLAIPNPPVSINFDPSYDEGELDNDTNSFFPIILLLMESK